MQDIQLFRSLVLSHNGTPVTTSNKIANVFGKQHKDVLRAIDKLGCSREFRERNFTLCHEINELQNGKPQPFYKITRDGFSFLCMGFTGKEASIWKENYIDAFNQMENHINRQQQALINLNCQLKDKLMSQHLRYRQMYRYLQKELTHEEIARCMQISTRMVRNLYREMRDLELLPEQEVFVLAHTGRISRVASPAQLGLEM